MALLICFAAAFQIGDRIPSGSFLLFGFLVSFICGCQFPAALYLTGESGLAAADAFSADLIGAAYGALVVSVVLIPFIGVNGAIAVLIGLKLTSVIVMGIFREKTQPS